MSGLKRVADPEGDKLVNEAGETVMQYATEPFRVGASMVVNVLRDDYAQAGETAMLGFARRIFETSAITDAQLIAVAREEATLRGFSPPGFSFHSSPCETCLGRGTLPDNTAVECPTCEGDCFAPPMASMSWYADEQKPA